MSLVSNELLDKCVEVITTRNVPLNMYRDALLLLASQDTGFWGRFARTKLDTFATEVSNNYVKNADSKKAHAFVITIYPMRTGNSVLFGDIPPARARAMLAGFGAGLISTSPWGRP